MVFALAEAEPVADWMLQLDGAEPKLAFCGTDAHGWPGYATAFRWMSIHLTGLAALPAPPAEGAQAVVQELRAPDASTARWTRCAPAAGLRRCSPRTAGRSGSGEVLEVQLPPCGLPDAHSGSTARGERWTHRTCAWRRRGRCSSRCGWRRRAWARATSVLARGSWGSR